ncbi:hypothetical protein ACWD01_18210 [Streptomyces sp. NPDC002835]
MDVPRGDGGPPTPVLTASPGLSLAWKLLWLCADDVARGKDLYDAVLLAESPRTHLDTRLLHRVLGPHAPAFGPDRIRTLPVDWRAFRAAHPLVTGSASAWRERLASALRRAGVV